HAPRSSPSRSRGSRARRGPRELRGRNRSRRARVRIDGRSAGRVRVVDPCSELTSAMQPIVVMGVSGSGKSTVGAALAQRLGVPFADADDFHPAANIAKMAAGMPLDDDDRRPWLEAIGGWLAAHGDGDGGVMSCSALKRTYRDYLRSCCPSTEFVHLSGSPEVIAARQAARTGHFMPPSLMASQ